MTHKTVALILYVFVLALAAMLSACGGGDPGDQVAELGRTSAPGPDCSSKPEACR